MSKGLEIVQKHMDQAGVIGCWEALAERIDNAITEAKKDALAGMELEDVAVMRDLLWKYHENHDIRVFAESEGRVALCTCYLCAKTAELLGRLPK